MIVSEVEGKNEYNNWKEWFGAITNLKGKWIYRGQSSSAELVSTLERECRKFGLELDPYAENIEKQMIRQFQRVYDGDDRQKVQEDTLYCISLMRHYGAPTRLLDFTYSKYVAMYFGLESAYENMPNNEKELPDYSAKRGCTIWCIDREKLLSKAAGIPEVQTLLNKRSYDKYRCNKTFIQLYMENKFTFALWETPLQLHRRLHLQQATFLCPGNIKVKLMNNLREPCGKEEPDFIKKFTYFFTLDELREAFDEFMLMDITRESLFPGLDGLATSMRYQLWFYKKLHEDIDKNKTILGVKT